MVEAHYVFFSKKLNELFLLSAAGLNLHMQKSKNFWLSICLVNLSFVAILGFILRSKIVFSIPAIDFGHMESAHSHFAFAGWVGLSIITLFVYDILPAGFSNRKIYQWLLWGVQVSAVGMACSFPFQGYGLYSIIFSTLYIIVTYVFAFVFFKDLLKTTVSKPVKLLAFGAIISLILSSFGPFGLSYIMITKSGNSTLYRNCIYTFLHFQYNGFFTLAIFGLVFNRYVYQPLMGNKNVYRFSLFLVLSVVPSLFLSLLWQNHMAFYILAGIGCLFILLCLLNLVPIFKLLVSRQLFTYGFARNIWIMSLISFILKMLLNVGTVIPWLGDAIYGNRPVIIGFLHLIFLGFVSFFLLSSFVEFKMFTRLSKLIRFPIVLFGTGIFANELLLMLQGLEILFQSNSSLYSWLLWGAAIILVLGAASMAIARYYVHRGNRYEIKNAPQL